MVVAANEEELQLILCLDHTEFDKDHQASPSIQQSTNRFTVNELISVLERISSSMIKPPWPTQSYIEHAREGIIYRFGLFCIRIC